MDTVILSFLLLSGTSTIQLMTKPGSNQWIVKQNRYRSDLRE